MKVALLILALLSLSGCCNDQVREVKEIKVPVILPCVESLPEKPSFPLQEAKVDEDLFTLAKKSLAEIEIRKGYEAELEASLFACKK